MGLQRVGHDWATSLSLSCYTQIYSWWNSPGQNPGVGSLSLLQGIFPTQGSNPGLLHWRQILYQLSHKGSPRILEWVAYSFSSRSSRPRNWTSISFIAGGFFTNWAIRDMLCQMLTGQLLMMQGLYSTQQEDSKQLFMVLVHELKAENAVILCIFTLLTKIKVSSDIQETWLVKKKLIKIFWVVSG